MNYKQAKQISEQSLFPFHFMPLANASVDISNGLAVFEKRAMSFVWRHKGSFPHLLSRIRILAEFMENLATSE